MDEDLIICRCEEIKKGEIIDTLEKGHTDMNEIKRITRAGMGLCQGKTCKRLVSRIIADFTGQNIADITPSTFRPPVRPIKLKFLMSCSDPNEEGRRG
jgi:NAD(P)H-nitrite reductase large subunit